jgi:hypothetical protein
MAIVDKKLVFVFVVGFIVVPLINKADVRGLSGN